MNQLSVNIRLFLLVGLLSLVSVIVGLMGLRGMSETVGGLRTVYEDRVVPLRDLKVIADLYAVNIVDMTHKVRVKVPVRLVGTAVGVKTLGGILDFVHREIEIECLPSIIPAHIDVVCILFCV